MRPAGSSHAGVVTHEAGKEKHDAEWDPFEAGELVFVSAATEQWFEDFAERASIMPRSSGTPLI